MGAIRSAGRAFLGLPDLGDPAPMTEPRIIPWRAAPAAFAVALAGLILTGLALQTALNGRDNWQVNAPAIAGLTTILLLASSSPTQPRARNAVVAATVGLAVVGGAFTVAIARQEPGTAYGVGAFLIATVGALAGCLEFTALTHVDRWTVSTPAGSTPRAVGAAEIRIASEIDPAPPPPKRSSTMRA
jgi:hypothetical protein